MFLVGNSRKIMSELNGFGGWNPVTSKVVFTFRLHWSTAVDVGAFKNGIRYSKTIPCHSRLNKKTWQTKNMSYEYMTPPSFRPKNLYWTERLRPHGILLFFDKHDNQKYHPQKELPLMDIWWISDSVKVMKDLWVLFGPSPTMAGFYEITHFLCQHLVSEWIWQESNIWFQDANQHL